jgi:hypothetical protein
VTPRISGLASAAALATPVCPARVSTASAITAQIFVTNCEKAGVPHEAMEGRITTHQFRATMVTKLATAKKPMTDFELSARAGHRDLRRCHSAP